jgi:hypothetical protein
MRVLCFVQEIELTNDEGYDVDSVTCCVVLLLCVMDALVGRTTSMSMTPRRNKC